MAKYRKKPVEIEAVRYIRGLEKEAVEFLGGFNNENEVTTTVYETDVAIFRLCHWDQSVSIEIKTLEGIMTVSDGDYIIKGVKGEFYPCKPDIFEATYERVETPLDRMMIEGRYLEDRISKIVSFIGSERFPALSNEEKILMNIQYYAMLAYSHALCMRTKKMQERADKRADRPDETNLERS